MNHHHEAAQRYAAADKSDPFTLARCHAHMRNNVANYRKNDEPFLWQAAQMYRYSVGGLTLVAPNTDDACDQYVRKIGRKNPRVICLGKVGVPKMERVTPEPDAHYNATEAQETRITTADDDYLVTVYRNIVRP